MRPLTELTREKRIVPSIISIHTQDVGFPTSLLVAVPAVVIAGLNLVAGDSLLPHIAALAAVPLGVAGLIGGVVGQPHRTHS